MQQNKVLILACLVILLTLLTLRAHAADLPLFGSGSSTMSAGFAFHMAELEYRRLAATVSQFVSFS